MSCLVELDADRQVRFTESHRLLGHVDSPDVREFLKELPLDVLDLSLHQYLISIYEDRRCCPQCGHRDFRELSQVDEVRYGFCAWCLITIHLDHAGEWFSFPKRRPYRRIRNKLAE